MRKYANDFYRIKNLESSPVVGLTTAERTSPAVIRTRPFALISIGKAILITSAAAVEKMLTVLLLRIVVILANTSEARAWIGK